MFGSTFDSSAGKLIASIAEDDRLTLSLNADLNAEVRLALSSQEFQISMSINELIIGFVSIPVFR